MPFGLVSAWNKRRRSKSQDQSDPWIYKPVEFWQLEDHNPPAKRCHESSVFTLKEMEEATCSFSDDNLLGKGGFGRVYKGTLRSGEVVAIKKMELPPVKEAQGEREFRVEVDMLTRLDHPNLVSLKGYCADGKHRFLVYEYMPNGNLSHIKSCIQSCIFSQTLSYQMDSRKLEVSCASNASASAVFPSTIHQKCKSNNFTTWLTQITSEIIKTCE